MNDIITLPYSEGNHTLEYEAEDFLLIPDTATFVDAALAVGGNTDFWEDGSATRIRHGVPCFVAVVIEHNPQGAVVLRVVATNFVS